MSLKTRIRDWLGIEERAIDPIRLWNTGQWVDLFATTASGQLVTKEMAMQAAQGACVRLLADDISSLPVDVYTREGRASMSVEPPGWMQPQSGLFLDYVSDWVTSLGLDGNVFTVCQPSVFEPESVLVLDPKSVDVVERDGNIRYVVPGRPDMGPAEVLHVPWVRLPGELRGIDPVRSSRESIGLELAATKWAGAYFANGGSLGGIVMAPGPMTQPDIDRLREEFAARHTGEKNWRKPAVLTGGADFKDVSATPQSAELEGLWRVVLEHAARLYHIPPHLLSVLDTGAAARASVEERGIAYVRHAVRPFATRFEMAHRRLLPEGEFLKLNLNALMRGDAKTRGEFYNLMLQGKTMTREEVRELEDLPYQGELGYLDTPNNQARDPRIEDVGSLIRAGFAPADALKLLGLPSMEHLGLPPVTVQGEETGGQRTVLEFGDVSARVEPEHLAPIVEAVTAILDEARSVNADTRATYAATVELASGLEERMSAIAERAETTIRESETPPDIRVDGEHVYYTRGKRVVRKRVLRDERGRLIGMVAA